MLTLVLAAALAGAPVEAVSSPSASRTEDTPWEFFTAMSGGFQPGSKAAVVTGRIGLTRRVTPVIVPELHLLASVAPGVENMGSGLRLGARFELPREGLRPFLYASFAHMHEAGFEHLAMAPVAMLLGLSEHGVVHRTGADAGAGVVYDFPKVRPGSLSGRAGLRVGTTALLGSGAPLTVDVLGTFGVLF